jgi:Zn finger protein HypA/HybF involved in hydrogenase expression
MSRPMFSQIETALQEDKNTGFCLACGAEKDCCEPDARNYQCDECGEYQVLGAEEILIAGLFLESNKRLRKENANTSERSA